MAKRCEICGKGPVVGRNISHAHNVTPRRFEPNLQRVRALVEGDIRVQTHRVFRNLAGILEAAGTSLERVVRATVYLADMNDFAAMNEVYGTYFSSPAPARSTIQAARLPRDARVEIDVIAEIANH